MRGKIIRTLTAGKLSTAELRQAVGADHRFEPALQALLDEGLIEVDQDNYSLTAASNTR
jgi:predicted transcriptional regulator